MIILLTGNSCEYLVGIRAIA